MRPEDDDSGLTTSRQTEVNREHRRNESELYIDFSDTFDDDEQEDKRGTGVLSEYDLHESNPSLYSIFTDEQIGDLTVDDFTKMIETIKGDARKYAGIY